MLTAPRLRELLHYDPETGIFTRRISSALGRVGSIAGTEGGHGQWKYWRIGLDGVRHKAHRIAWLYVHGEWPSAPLDHVDCDGLNNRIANLRLCTASQNMANQRKSSRNTSGFKGVYWHKTTRKWYATLRYDGKNYHLGTFATPEEAHEAYRAGAEKQWGEYARAA